MTRDKKRLLRRSFQYLLPYWHAEALAFLVALVTSCLALVYPWINKILIDEVILQQDFDMLRWVCGALLAAVVLQNVFSVLQRFLFSWIGERAVLDVRAALLARLLELSLRFFAHGKVGRLMSTLTSDVAAMQVLYTSTVVGFLTDALRLAVTLGVLFWIDWELALLVVPVLPLFVVILKRFSGPVRSTSRRVQDETARLSGDLQETLGGMREIKAYRQEAWERRRFAGLFRRLLGLRVRHGLVQSGSSAAAEAVAMGGVVLALFFGGIKAIGGELQMGVLIAFVNYLGSLFAPVARFAELNNRLQSGLGSAERVFELLDGTAELRERRGGRRLERLVGSIRFAEVGFGYEPGQRALERVDFEIAPGELVALVGESGSGKSTLAALLLGFYDDYEGRILIDGHELRELDLGDWRRRVGVVFQESLLFDLSVADNIRLGRRDASLAAVEAAARAAFAEDFIRALPEGYETRLGERGVKLSGGQRQRLAIARALLLDPRVLILDEATSALDSSSEERVRAALERLMAGRTSLVIAHRLSTVRRADRIVVLSRGRVIESGRHAELLRAGGAYRRLHEEQFGAPAVALAQPAA